MSDIGLESINRQDNVALLSEQRVQAALVGEVKRDQFFVALDSIEYSPFSDLNIGGLQTLMDLWHTAMLGKPPPADECNHV